MDWLLAQQIRPFIRLAALASLLLNVAMLAPALYMLQVPFFMLTIVGLRALSALRKNHVLLLVAAAAVVVNLVGDLVLVEILGLPGIALSTTVVYALASATVFTAVFRDLRRSERTPT